MPVRSLILVAALVSLVAAAGTATARAASNSVPWPTGAESSHVDNTFVRSGYTFNSAANVLRAAVSDGAFPGAVAVLADSGGVVFAGSIGSFTYGAPVPFPSPERGANPPMDLDTVFDMASCSKILSATAMAGVLYQDGFLPLETPIVSLLGPEFGAGGKENVTVLNCLLHNAGFAPDPSPNWWSPEFACPQTGAPDGPALDFSCRNQIYTSLLATELAAPPNHRYVYSDLSMITLMFAMGRLVGESPAVQAHYGLSADDVLPDCLDGSPAATGQCWFEAFVRRRVFDALGMDYTGFLPAAELAPQCAPTEDDTVYEKRQIQGVVSDGNAYALGGISGHAGVFSTVMDALRFAYEVLYGGKEAVFWQQSTIDLFSREYNHTQSSRALGFNTNDPAVFDQGWGLSCGNLSSTTYMHLGYTGTQICIDPQNQLITLLLTNRVYPSSDNTKIEAVRPQWNSAALHDYHSAAPAPRAPTLATEATSATDEDQRERGRHGGHHRHHRHHPRSRHSPFGEEFEAWWSDHLEYRARMQV